MDTKPTPVLLIAGNGFTGQAIARRLIHRGHAVTVLHTGRRPVPVGKAVAEIVVERTSLPIVAFPPAALRASRDAVVIHCQCMGGADGEAFRRTFEGIARRLVLLSSCDVYRAYGRFTGFEPGPPEATPMDEGARLRGRLYPYRHQAVDSADLLHWYDKIVAERAFRKVKDSEVVILRLPKLFGSEHNADLATVYQFGFHGDWRWTHGFVENVAEAIALCAWHPDAAGNTFNVGESSTPTVSERLASLPDLTVPPRVSEPMHPERDFRQNLHFDTGRIRQLLGYRDLVDEAKAMRQLAEARWSDERLRPTGSHDHAH